MSTNPPGGLRQRYPLLAAYGNEPLKFLSHAEAIAAGPQDRIRSIWPFLVRLVLEFGETLNARAAANYDPEDVLADLVITLTEKDSKWDPGRGKYLSFAGKIITNELHAIRDRAGTVHGPRNSTTRIRGYQRGVLTAKKRKTYGDIRRALREHDTYDPERALPDDQPGVPAACAATEAKHAACATVRAGLAALEPAEAEALARTFGLFGRPAQGLAEVAGAMNRSHDAIRRTLARAQQKFKAAVESTSEGAPGVGP
jgi:DNA-directed RNA polymerase specialized sigma24 family protein